MATPFVCTDCGRCCRSIGRTITIERRVTGRQYDCRESVHGERFRATVKEEYRGTVPGSEGCPFLVWQSLGGSVCACYPTRPRVCREFRCARLRIYDTEGTVRGRLVGHGSLLTEDGRLLACWKTLEPARIDDPSWRDDAGRTLARAGYRGEWYD